MQNKMKIFDKIQIKVKSAFGTVDVEFTIIAEINKPNHIYGLVAQNRVVVGQYMANNTWKLSVPIDLMKISTLDTLHLDVTNECELNSLANTCKTCGCESEFDYCSELCYLTAQNESELNSLENQTNEC
jgi:hypothetical protein